MLMMSQRYLVPAALARVMNKALPRSVTTSSTASHSRQYLFTFMSLPPFFYDVVAWASFLYGDLACEHDFSKGQARHLEHQGRAWPAHCSHSREGYVRASSQPGHRRGPREDCRAVLDADRGDWPRDVHRIGVEVTTSRSTGRRTRRERQTLEVALSIAPMKGEGGLDRVERRGSGPAFHERDPRPLH